MAQKIQAFDYLLVRSGPATSCKPAIQLFVSRCNTEVEEPAPLAQLIQSEEEIDDIIQALKEELDEVGRSAKTALSNSRPDAT